MKLVSTIIPTYNESMNVTQVIDRLLKAAQNKYLTEIIIVDDDSPDRTWEIAQEFVEKRKLNQVKVIRRMNQRGLASAITTGIKAAKGDIISWIDADLGVPPEIISRLVIPLNQYDVAIASRYVKNGGDPRPKIRALLSRTLNIFIKNYLQLDVKDCTSCVVAAKKHVFEKVNFSTQGFGEFFIEFIYKCKKYKFKTIEISVVYEPKRAGGKSKSDGDLFTLLKLGFKYGLKTLSLRFKK